ncbi:MAG: hypothetical protein LC808_02665 [Actinobacteria bacterium]|nr:hypothetical protein [Actinomycetota bacterium]
MTADNKAAPAPFCGRPPQVRILDLASDYWKTQATFVPARPAAADALGRHELIMTGRCLPADVPQPGRALVLLTW